MEGRYPNPYISAKLAAVTQQKAKHILHQGLGRQYYKDLILKLIDQYHIVSREDINQLLVDKLPEGLSISQKDSMVHNLLTNFKSKGIIENTGSKRAPKWRRKAIS